MTFPLIFLPDYPPDLDKSKIEKIRSSLDVISDTTSEKASAEDLIGRHKWDVLEYEKFKFIKLYPR
jgi:hypothetical protein